jgi:hypothetical protein
MLTQDEQRETMRQWDAMTQGQRDALRVTLNTARQAAKERPVFKLSILETWRTSSESVCEEAWNWLWPDYFDEGVETAIELAFLTRLFSPAVMAWEHAYAHVMTALADPAIAENPATQAVLQGALSAIDYNADDTQKPEHVFWFLADAESLKAAMSHRARLAAMAKNEAPRAWVRIEWQDRGDKGQSKAAFARQYAALVRRRFDLDVTSDTIARDWLPKGKDPAA